MIKRFSALLFSADAVKLKLPVIRSLVFEGNNDGPAIFRVSREIKIDDDLLRGIGRWRFAQCHGRGN
jgi:hypothetical protein